MEKPELKISLHQIFPALPDPHQFAERISESIRFIDENPNATAADITPEMIELWSVDEDELVAINSHINELGQLYLKPSAVSSLIIFTHIYLSYYRQEDFGDLENLIYTYERFSKLLHMLSICNKSRITMLNIEIFDLANLDENIDLVGKYS